MKCEKCGKNEANYHFTSNINGVVTESHLCSRCAEKAGLDRALFPKAEDMFEDMFSGFFGGMFSPRRMFSPWGEFERAFAPAMTMMLPHIAIRVENEPEKAEDKA